MTPLHDLNPPDLYNWVCVYETSVDFDAEFVRGLLADADIPANILSKKDSAYSTNVGHLSLIYVYVPESHRDEALSVMDSLNNEDSAS
jgi:hypothetical protein